MLFPRKRLLWLLASVGLAWGQPHWQVRPDPIWDRAFQRNWGWNGADGAYSVGLQGGWTGWVFSDTFVGSVVDGARRDNRFLHNSWARIQGSFPCLAWFSDRPLLEGWNWVYQPYLKDGVGYLFVGRFQNLSPSETSPPVSSEGETPSETSPPVFSEGETPSETSPPAGFDFAQVGCSLVPLDWRELAPRTGTPVEVPHFRSWPVLNWGASVLVGSQGLTYVYGSRDRQGRQEVVLARTPQVAEFEQWTFWDGTNWVPQPEKACSLSPGSNEFSVFEHRGEFRLLVQQGPEIWLARGRQPWGPFEERVCLWRLDDEGDGIWSYNAKAHPELGWPLLISYNRNSFPPERTLSRADRYRPRFLRLSEDPWLP